MKVGQIFKYKYLYSSIWLTPAEVLAHDLQPLHSWNGPVSHSGQEDVRKLHEAAAGCSHFTTGKSAADLLRARELYYRVPRVLDNTGSLWQDLDELLGLSLTEDHATNGGNQGLVWQVEGTISICRHWREKQEWGCYIKQQGIEQ